MLAFQHVTDVANKQSVINEPFGKLRKVAGDQIMSL